jgi:hypothetical protein
MMKKAISLLLAAGLALSAVPVGAQTYGPNTVWGTVPEGAKDAANAVLLDPSGKTIATVPVIDGKFAFLNVTPGDYTVGLYTAAGAQVTKACPLALASGSVLEAAFTCAPVAAAVVPAGGGISTTAWILMGAAAAGVTTAIVIASGEDENVASPIR